MSKVDVKGALDRVSERGAAAAAAEADLQRGLGLLTDARKAVAAAQLALDEVAATVSAATAVRDGALGAVEECYAELESLNVPRSMAQGYVAMMGAIMAQAEVDAPAPPEAGSRTAPHAAAPHVVAPPARAAAPPAPVPSEPEGAARERPVHEASLTQAPVARSPTPSDGPVGEAGAPPVPGPVLVAPVTHGPVPTAAAGQPPAPARDVERDLFAVPPAGDGRTAPVSHAGGTSAKGAHEVTGADPTMPESLPVEEDDPQFGYDPDWHARRDIPDDEDAGPEPTDARPPAAPPVTAVPGPLGARGFAPVGRRPGRAHTATRAVEASRGPEPSRAPSRATPGPARSCPTSSRQARRLKSPSATTRSRSERRDGTPPGRGPPGRLGSAEARRPPHGPEVGLGHARQEPAGDAPRSTALGHRRGPGR